MKMTSDMRDDGELDGLFDRARGESLPPSAALMDRILADAQAQLPHASSCDAPRQTPQVTGFWASLLAGIGGGGGLAGLSTAAVTGLLLGFLQPAPIEAPVSALTEAIWTSNGAEQVELMAGYDDIFTEG